MTGVSAMENGTVTTATTKHVPPAGVVKPHIATVATSLVQNGDKTKTHSPKSHHHKHENNNLLPTRTDGEAPKSAKTMKVPSLLPLSPNVAPTAVATSNNKRAKSPAGSDDSDDMPLAKRFSSTVDVKPDVHNKDKHKEHNDKNESKHKDKHRDKQEQKNNVHKDIKKEETVKSKEEKKKVEKTQVKAEIDSDDEPLSNRLKKHSDEDDEYKPEPKHSKKHSSSSIKTSKSPSSSPSKTKHADVKRKSNTKPETGSPKKVKKEEEPKWKWWEEERREDGVKWTSLQHAGPMFAPPYEPLPKNVHFKYDSHVMRLSPNAEEVAGFYARMIDHDYTKKETFNANFFHDWRKTMTHEEREVIKDLKKCDFREIDAYYKEKTEERKNMSKEQKQILKEQRAKEQEQYGTAMMDHHPQKIANFRIEPPGLFRGRGDHPKMGKLKKRVMPEDVTINCSKDSSAPRPPEGHRWKEVRHDNTVSWLAGWSENVLGQNKYIMLNPSSRLKGEKDMQKFDTARRLHAIIDKIRERYHEDMKSKEMRLRQQAVAMYFIDKLALRAGNEKDTDEAADTVGCCSLRVEHIRLHDVYEDKQHVVEFDFLGKDSIRYQNWMPVEKRVYKNLQLFKENKQDGDDLFDRLNTSTLNQHLRDIMPGLSAKVFRTYNASITLQRQLNEISVKGTVHEMILHYNRANRKVAILCNHQRAVPKTHEKSMENLKAKEKERKAEIKELKKELERARGADKERLEKKLKQKKDMLAKQRGTEYVRSVITDKDENKQIALGTSKLNYLDPRITVAWCLKHDVQLERIYSKTQREKFQWAIDMTEEDYDFSKVGDLVGKAARDDDADESDE